MPTASPRRVELIVFSDDWGRHPSSCQHLVRCFLRGGGDTAWDLTWVNTIGTRGARLTAGDLRRGVEKIRAFASLRPGFARVSESSAAQANHSAASAAAGEPRVVSPVMWPGFRASWQRRTNAWSMARAVRRTVGPRTPGVERVVLTTLPIAADLPGRLDADRWVYMAVDDFSVWPGLDGEVMDAMERRLVARVDAAFAASETLQARLASMGRPAEPLTHGVDLDAWRGPTGPPPAWLDRVEGKLLVFWGLIDARLDAAWCRALAERSGATLALVGPTDGGVPAGLLHPRIVTPGRVDPAALPAVAARADVLVMPYVDAAVTRAMQPLKLKEYLATDRPAVVRRLPATAAWADACDAVADETSLLEAVARRLEGGLPASQRRARERLVDESWPSKAKRLAAALTGDDAPRRRLAA